jgi:hypothetical protein
MAVGVIRLDTDQSLYLIFSVKAYTTSIPFNTAALARHFGLRSDGNLVIMDPTGV